MSLLIGRSLFVAVVRRLLFVVCCLLGVVGVCRLLFLVVAVGRVA